MKKTLDMSVQENRGSLAELLKQATSFHFNISGTIHQKVQNKLLNPFINHLGLRKNIYMLAAIQTTKGKKKNHPEGTFGQDRCQRQDSIKMGNQQGTSGHRNNRGTGKGSGGVYRRTADRRAQRKWEPVGQYAEDVFLCLSSVREYYNLSGTWRFFLLRDCSAGGGG